MSREKQIEEMAKDLYGYSIDTEEDCDFVAKLLCAKGYRKQSEGEWVFKEDKDDFVCSVCGAAALCDGNCVGIDWIMQELSDYCPHCGSKMKGGAE